MQRTFKLHIAMFFLLIANLSFAIENRQIPAEPRDLVRTNHSIQVMEKRVQSTERDYFGNAALGKLYYRKARQTGDIAYYQKAETVLVKALQIKPDYARAKADLAAVYGALHRFPEALSYASQLQEKNPGNVEILAIMADAYLEMGDYENAENICRKIVQDHPDDPGALARQAHLEELMGNPEEARELVKKATEKFHSSGLQGETLAWFYSRLGDLYFHTGSLETAEQNFLKSLNTFPNFYIALNGLAEVRKAQKKNEEAIVIYRKLNALKPSAHTWISLGNLYSQNGNDRLAAECYSQAENMFSDSLYRSIYSRELAALYADREKNLEEALEIAQHDLKTRKDIGGYNTLAWVLYKLGRFQEAESAMSQALKLNTKEPDFYLHAYHIYAAAGMPEKSSYYATEMKRLWPYLAL